MSKLAIILITLFASSTIILGALTLRYATPFFKDRSSTALEKTATSSPQKTFEPDKIAAMSLTNPALKGLKILYTLNGTVKIIQNTNSGQEIILDINPEKLPQMIISKETRLVFRSDQKETKATASDLKAGQNVNIYFRYGLKQQKWEIEKIEILSNTPSSSPSPKAK